MLRANRFFIRANVVAAALLAVAVSARAQQLPTPISIVDGRGKVVRLNSVPHRIISLAPNTTEILYALGDGARLIADTSRCNYPPAATRLAHIGDFRTSIENVVALRPDLVVASISANGTALASLDRLKIPTFAVDASNFSELYKAILLIGAATGSGSAARLLVGKMRHRAERVAKRISRAVSRPLVLAVVQDKPLMIAAGGTFTDALIRAAGGINAASGASQGYILFSPERVVVAKPEWLLGSSTLANYPGWASLPAVLHHHIFDNSSDIFNRAGPRLIDALEMLAHTIHPELDHGAT